MIDNLIMLGLFLFPTWLQQTNSAQPQAVRFHRFENIVGIYRLEESMIDLGEMARKPEAKVVMRICSKEPLVKSAFLAAALPSPVCSYATNIYGVAPERVLLSRSEGCLSKNTKYAATELWVVPKRAATPPSIESISLCQLKSESIRLSEEIRNARQFRAGLRRLVEVLREHPQTFGVVSGSFYERPSSSMRRRLFETRKVLQRSGLPANRYLIHFGFYRGEWTVGDPEPKCPILLSVEATEKCPTDARH